MDNRETVFSKLRYVSVTVFDLFKFIRINGDESSKSAASIIEKNKLKTSLCVNFVANGSCPFGTECRFAHSVKELKLMLNLHIKSEGEMQVDNKSYFLKGVT